MDFSQPKKTPDGRYYVKVASEVFLQIDNVTLLSPFAEGDSVTLGLNEKALEQLRDNDAIVLQAAKENSTLWFQREVQEKTLDTAYTRSFKDTTMNVTKILKSGKLLTSAYDHKHEKIDPNSLTENTQCDVILEFSGVWFAKKTFGSTWRIVQIRTKPPRRPPPVYSEQCLFKSQEEDPVSSDDEYM
jgi:hypothetical protein